jgi:Dienelactone hydrolase family
MKAFPGIPEWTQLHPVEKIEAQLSKLIPAVKEELPSSTLPLVGVGYCFGGKYALRLAASSALDAAAAFHPVSRMIIPFLKFTQLESKAEITYLKEPYQSHRGYERY